MIQNPVVEEYLLKEILQMHLEIIIILKYNKY